MCLPVVGFLQQPVINTTPHVIIPANMLDLGEQHRRQRRLLNPMFSGSHVSDLTPMFNNIAQQVRDLSS